METTGDSSVQWWIDRHVVVALARALVESYQLGDEHSVIDFFSEPHRWTTEYLLWSAVGRPDGPGHPRFDELLESYSRETKCQQ
jgi:hypothetical protein